MILLSKRIIATTRVRRLNAKDLTRGIKNIGHQNNLENSTPLIAELRVD